MEIKVRKIGPYKDITIKTEDSIIQLGLFDDKECAKLIETLKEAINDLE